MAKHSHHTLVIKLEMHDGQPWQVLRVSNAIFHLMGKGTSLQLANPSSVDVRGTG